MGDLRVLSSSPTLGTEFTLKKIIYLLNYTDNFFISFNTELFGFCFVLRERERARARERGIERERKS